MLVVQERLAAETLLIEKRFAREAGQLGKKDSCRAAQPASSAQEEHIKKLQAQLKNAETLIAGLRTEQEGLLFYVRELEDAKAKFAIEIEQHEATIAEVQDKLSGEQQDNSKKEASIQQLATALAEAEAKAKLLEDERSTLSVELQQLAEAAEAEQRLHAEVGAMREEISRSRAALEEAERRQAAAEETVRRELRAQLQEEMVQLNVSQF